MLQAGAGHDGSAGSDPVAAREQTGVCGRFLGPQAPLRVSSRPQTGPVLDVRQSPELQAAVLALRQADRHIKRSINRDARAQLTPVWQAGLSRKARGPLERRAILPGAKITAGDRRLTAAAATSRRKLSGGLIPALDYPALEWGAKPRKRNIHGRSRRGSPYQYSRTINTQFRPRTEHGHVAMAAAGDVIGEAVVLWLGVIVDHFRRNFDVKAGR